MEIKLIDYGAVSRPQRAHPNDTGMDVFTREAVVIPPHSVRRIPLGFGIEVPACATAFIFPRSGWATQGILPQLSPIDPGYSGEVHAIVLNANPHDFILDANTKVGPLVFLPVHQFDLVAAPDTSRGASGFGSTGL